MGNIKPPVGWGIDYGHPLAKGLVGAWLMNEGGGTLLKDLTYINKGTSIAIKFQLANGKKAVYYNGSAYTNCGSSSLNNIGAVGNSFSLSFWVNRLNVDTTGQNIITHGDFTFGKYPIVMNPGAGATMRFVMYDGTNNPIVTDATTMPANTWIHYVAVRNVATDTLYLYRNYKTVFTATDTTTATCANAAPFVFGGNTNNTQVITASYNGMLDVVMLYSRALTPTEVQQLYSSPYCFMRPRKIRIPFVTLGGEVTPPSGNITISANVIKAHLKPQAPTLRISVAVSTTTIKASLKLQTPLVKISVAVSTTVQTARVKTQSPTIKISYCQALNVIPARLKLYSPTVNLTGHVTLALNVINARLKLYAPTIVASGEVAGVLDIIRLASEVENVIMDSSRITNTIPKKSRMEKVIKYASEI